MNDLDLACQNERRRQKARDKNFNGIDYVEIDETQTVLCVHLFGETPANIDKTNVRIEGGRRVRNIQILDVYPQKEEDEELGECLRVIVDKAGDFSTYTLRLFELKKDADGKPVVDANGKPLEKTLPGFDPRYASVSFSFKVNCPSDLDCKTAQACVPENDFKPEINYLAKDYASFRQLILDRLALVMPDWQERHAPDIGIALVEVLAYVGDSLSYYQDAVATESYLDTARLRISVRRHARLVDYKMHEGCNARAWLCIATDSYQKFDPQKIYFITNTFELEQFGKRLMSEDELLELRIPANLYDVFEPLTTDKIEIYAAHTTINFYTWDDAECCLPIGATRATLQDAWQETASTSDDAQAPINYAQTSQERIAQQAREQCDPPDKDTRRQRQLHLKIGDVLIFEEVLGAKTGNPADADPRHRHAVRLTKVKPDIDPLFNQPVVEIQWAEADALPFALCISATTSAPNCQQLEDISVARGNVILVDNGKTVRESLGQVAVKTEVGACECGTTEMTKLAEKFQPILKNTPLTFSQTVEASLPATLTLVQNPRQALPQIHLTGISESFVQWDESEDAKQKTAQRQMPTPNRLQHHWHPQSDLLNSQSDDLHFVVEMDNEGFAHLRFGDGESGRMPEALSEFAATYRVGNGKAGNVGAEAITHLVMRKKSLSGAEIQPRNPLAAQGGTPPEPLAEVKMFAPGAIRKDLQRAITADDYARLVERNKKVQRAAAELRWTGSWYEARVFVDQRGSEEFDAGLQKEITDYLYRYRRMGQDLAVASARYVPIEIALKVCVLPHYQSGHVEAALLDVFSSRILPDGQKGLFHPDNLTFGEGIFLSKLIAAAQAVEGVANVSVTQLQRRFETPADEIEKGILSLNLMEIAQLDNDPNFPEHGKLQFDMNGGRGS
jgi:hypothetical protein